MKKFIDEARIKLKAGDGGKGSMSFFRGPNIPKGGPDGGDGGRGGSIFLEASPHLESLLDFKYQGEFKAQRGEDGRGSQCYGKSGDDMTIPVPLGTQIKNENGDILADLTEIGERIKIARGGKGGLGNVHFKSSTRQAPRIATPGEPGEEKVVFLELKSLSDIGFVGYPNAGKSSLLRALTAAEPKVGNYPFTTLQPQLGVLELGERRIRLADVPGLIEGAHENKGLGLQFLKHISRSQALFFVLSFQEEMSLETQLNNLVFEIESYDPQLLLLPSLIVVNKSDLLEDSVIPEDIREIWREEWAQLKCPQGRKILISAQHHQGLNELQEAMKELLFTKEAMVS